ncbi:MAG: hypothetical protein ABIB43_04995 [archaeon]
MYTIHEKHRNKWMLFAFICLVILLILILSDKLKNLIVIANFTDSIFLLVYLPGFFLITGLIEAWLPAKFIAKHLGKHSGLKGSIYSFLIGTLMIGPLYLAFPIAVVLLKKGISKLNVILFISAWSVFPIGQEIFEIHFMGFKFFILRAFFSIIFAVVISLIMNRLNVVEKVKLKESAMKKN